VKTNGARTLLLGYGNPGRADDGLGPALADTVEKLGIPDVTVDAAYQLSVEDAEAISRHDVVVFADADSGGPEPFSFQAVRAKAAVSFSTHRVEPAALLALAEELFGAHAEGYVLGIRGYEFQEFSEQLTPRAAKNLAAAAEFIAPVLRERSFRTACPAPGVAGPRRAKVLERK
jgi:hydrogenase maturation protease